MKLRSLYSKLSWPSLFLAMMLQRSPVIRFIAEVEFGLLPRTQHLWQAVVAAVTVGAYNAVTAASGDLIFHEGEDDTTVFVGENLRLVVEVEGSKLLRPKTWVVEGELPDGVTHEIRQDLGLVIISGIPTQSGIFPIVVRAWELANMMGDEGTPIEFNIVVESLGPVITSQTSDQTLVWGESLNLSVSVDMPEGVTYQWQRILSGETEYTDLNGETGNMLSIDNITSADEGMYRVVATNSEGSTTSASASIVVTPIPPSFTEHPTDQTVDWGGALNLSATVEIPEGTTYQWQRILAGESEYQNLESEVGSTLSMNNLTSADEGMYRVIATNSDVSTISDAAMVTLSITAFETWKETHFDDPFSSEADFNSDPDFDTLINAVEFAFGLNPLVSEKGALFQTNREEINGIEYVVFVFPPLVEGAESELNFESNDNLDSLGWTALANGANGVIIDALPAGLVVKVPASQTGFKRLRIIIN